MTPAEKVKELEEEIVSLRRQLVAAQGDAQLATSQRDEALARVKPFEEHHDALVATIRPDLTDAKPDPKVKAAHDALQAAMDKAHLELIPKKGK